jgi:SAM-dependent methyltransferase
MEEFSYFDEAYFQDGEKRGTAYRNYREVVKTSPIFREIARALVDIFRPRRALEIGCATGIMVKHLNDWGVEAHGIDVSKWAVAHREHPNVRLASAGELPYGDGMFDLVYSCHSLEHLPDTIVNPALRELTRVSAGIQFHMLPMVGTPPYVGPPDEVISQLRKDPTHQQLHPANWWRERIAETGMDSLAVGIQLTEDNEVCELTYGQLLFRKHGAQVDERGIAQRAFEWNCAAFRLLKQKPREVPRSGSLDGSFRRPHVAPAQVPASASTPSRSHWQQLARELPGRGLSQPRAFLADVLHLAGETLQPTLPSETPPADATLPEEQKLVFAEQAWKDIHREFPPAHELDLRSEHLLLVVGVDGPACMVRLALSQDQQQEAFANCLEYTLNLKPGLNWFICEQKDFRTLRGQPDPTRINRLAFGGAAQGTTLRVWVLGASGRSILG